MKLNRNLPWKGAIIGGLLAYYISVLSRSFYQFSPRLGKLLGAPFRGLAYLLQFIGPGSAGTDLAYNYATLFLVLLGLVLGFLLEYKMNGKKPLKFLRWYYPAGVATVILILFLSQSSYLGKQRANLTGNLRIYLSSPRPWSVELVPGDELYQRMREILLETRKPENQRDVENPEHLIRDKQAYRIHLSWDRNPILVGRWRSVSGYFIPEENILIIDEDEQYSSPKLKSTFQELEEGIFSFEQVNRVRLYGREESISLTEEQLRGLKQNLVPLNSDIVSDTTEQGRIVEILLEGSPVGFSEESDLYEFYGAVKLPEATVDVSLHGWYHQPTGILVFDRNHIYQVRESLR